MLHAIADAAGHDPEVERVYHGLIERSWSRRPTRIEADIAAGRIAPMDAAPTAAALVWMNERYLLMTLGRLPQNAGRHGRRDARDDLDAHALHNRHVVHTHVTRHRATLWR